MPSQDAAAATPAAAPVSAGNTVSSVGGGNLKIHIGEGRGIDLEIPMGLGAGAVAGGAAGAV